MCEWEKLEGLEKGLEHPAKDGGVCAPLRVMAALRVFCFVAIKGEPFKCLFLVVFSGV